MRVLVVDDDYVSRTKLKALLTSLGGDCDALPDGEMVIKMFEKAHEESVPYDLITMDVEMPGMSGQEVVQKIRESESSNGIDVWSHKRHKFRFTKTNHATLANRFGGSR